MDDEINPEIPEKIITNEINPEEQVDELNKKNYEWWNSWNISKFFINKSLGACEFSCEWIK